jgi:hypothetical protein
MPLKTPSAQTWALPRSADGRRWSRYPAGDALDQDLSAEDYWAEDCYGPDGLLGGAAGAAASAVAALAHGVPLGAGAAGAGAATGAVTATPASALTSFTLKTAATSGTYPFSIGLGFKKGDASSSLSTSLSSYQVAVTRTWSDGSIKHAIMSGRAALVQNVPLVVTVAAGTAPGGTALTSANIATATPSASVQCGAFGTVSLAGLLASPVRTWVSGAEMVECHYRADVGSSLMSVWFHVRLFADGRVWLRAICENGYLDNGAGGVSAGVDRSYVPTVAINGSTVYNNAGTALTHYDNTRWCVEGWIGGDPQVQPLHDVAYLRSTKLVPNYAYTAPSGTALNALAQSYSPMAQGAV